MITSKNPPTSTTTSLLQLVCAFIIFTTVFTTILPATAKIYPPLQIDAIRTEYISLEKALWQYLAKNGSNTQDMQLKKVYDSHRKFINDNMNSLFDTKKFNILDNDEWSFLASHLLQIDGVFRFFKNYMNQEENSADLNERNILSFTETVLLNNATFSMSRTFQDIESIMVNRTVYYHAIVQSTSEICNIKQSIQQFLYTLYTDISLTELKGYAMMEFSWMMLHVYGKGNFIREATLMRQDYEKRTERTLKLLRELMLRSDRNIWRCDPTHYVEGKTYEELTRLLQGYIENEVDMNTDQTCREECHYYVNTRSEGCFKNQFCSRQPRCTGKIYNCKYIVADGLVCLADTNSIRRYHYIVYDNGRVFGKKTQCRRGTTKVESWHRYIFLRCSYCFCLCDEASVKSDRYFNLHETLSDIKHNKVITGLRFVKQNRVFHIQIQEGELMPRGSINSSSLSWKPVDNYKVTDRLVRSGQDFHTLSFGNRTINLDDIQTDDSLSVVTGVRFRIMGVHLDLEARFTEFNFETGKLMTSEIDTSWKSNDNTDVSGEKRKKLSLRNPDIPTRTIVESIPDSGHNQCIDFTNTDMDKDAAQSTVPFIDIQDVISNPPVPLSGIGIYHKGRQGYGGFLAPKIITYDFTPHIQVPTTKSK